MEEINFGEVPIGFDVTRVFSATNEGERKLIINGFALRPEDAPFGVEGGTVSLGLNQNQDFIVHFRPTAIEVYEADLEILHEGDNTEPVLIRLKGIGIDDKVCTGCAVKTPNVWTATCRWFTNTLAVVKKTNAFTKPRKWIARAVVTSCLGFVPFAKTPGVPEPLAVVDAGPEPFDAGMPVIDTGPSCGDSR